MDYTTSGINHSGLLFLYPKGYIFHNNYVSLHPLRYNNRYEFIRTH